MDLNIFLFGLLTLSTSVIASEKVIVCYYGTWATYRWGDGQFNVEQLNPHLCTHLVYAFAGINSAGTVVSLDSHLDLPQGRDNFAKFNALKQKNPNLKTILAVGGWNEGSGKYSIMAASATLRRNFVSSALQMVLEHGFDGFDVDWEYPNQRDTINGRADIDNFTQLLKELREDFDHFGLLITAAVSAVKSSASRSYNIPAISKYLDLVCLMSYDMSGAWDPLTGHNAPLHRGEGDANVVRDNLHTVDVAVEYWLDQGCPPEKLVIGLPLYGRTFTLASAHVNSPRAPSSGAGIAGPYTVTSGSIGYNEFCYKLKTESWDIKYDHLAKVPYAVQNRNWVSYDDPYSLAIKVEYALAMKVAGVMVWSIETDDFQGLCSDEDFPLLRAINRALERNHDSGTGGTDSSTTTTVSTTTTASPSISSTTGVPGIVPEPSEPGEPSQPGSSICTSIGYAANPNDCSTFYYCMIGVDGTLVPQLFSCPGNLHWDATNHYCNYPNQAGCSV